MTINDCWRAERAGVRWLSRSPAAPSGPAVPEHGVLLATKLHVPRPRPGFVPRPRLAEGKSNQAIAGQLVVTLDMVKKHVSHLLGKLGAANRTEAVSRARELSLIR